MLDTIGYELLPPEQRRTLDGLHGIHVLAGMGVITWLIIRSVRGHFGPEYFTPVDLGGLYWHVVDLIWIFLFPLLYLIG